MTDRRDEDDMMEEDEVDDGTIEIPCKPPSTDVVEIDKDDLPEDVEDILDVLKNEEAAPNVWVEVAIAYFQHEDMAEQFEEILEEATSADVMKMWERDPNTEDARARLFTMMASLWVRKFADPELQSSDERKRDRYKARALEYFQKASDAVKIIDSASKELIIIGRGILFFESACVLGSKKRAEDLAKADKEFRLAAKIENRMFESLTLACQALVHFRNHDYEKAKKKFKQVIRDHPECPASIRVGLGYCFYELALESPELLRKVYFRKAALAFRRAIALEPSNVEANVGLAVMRLKEEGHYTHEILQTFRDYGLKNATALNHLAQNKYFNVLDSLDWSEELGCIDVDTGGYVLRMSESYREKNPTKDFRKMVRSGDSLIINKRDRPNDERGQSFVVDHKRAVTKTTIPLLNEWREGPLRGGDLYIKKYKRSLKFARQAYLSTKNRYLQAESCFLMGRIYQTKGDYAKALPQFKQSIRLDGRLTQSRYGLAQMYVASDLRAGTKRMRETAMKDLENLASSVDDADTLILLGMLYARARRVDLAIKNLRKARELDPSKYEAWPILAQLLLEQAAAETSNDVGTRRANASRKSKIVGNLPEAKKILRETLRQMNDKKEWIPPEMWNNIFALTFNGSDLSKDDDRIKITNLEMFLKKAKEMLLAGKKDSVVNDVDDESENSSSPLEVTRMYNLALLCERAGRLEEAESLHGKILDTHPTYTDSLCRIGSMYRDAGRYESAKMKYGEAAAKAKESKFFGSKGLNLLLKRSDPVILEANLQLEKAFQERGDPTAASDLRTTAQRTYERLIKEDRSMKSDSYAHVALGNLYHGLLSHCSKKEKFFQYISVSYKFFGTVLKKEPENIYAANGLAMLLAQQCDFQRAREVFERLRESAIHAPSVWVNLANAYVLCGQAASAVQLYRTCREKFCGVGGASVSGANRGGSGSSTRSSSIMTSANLRFLEANAQFVCKNYRAAVELLSTALTESPENKKIWQALARVSEEWGVSELISKKATKTLEDVEDAIQSIETAKKLYEFLARETTSEKRKENLQAKAQHLVNTLSKASVYKEHQKKKDDEKRKKAAELKMTYQRREAEVKRKAAEKRNRGLLNKDRIIEQRAKVAQEEWERRKAEWARRNQEDETKKREEELRDSDEVNSAVVQQIFGSDDDSDDDSDGEEATSASKTAAPDKVFAESDDDDDDNLISSSAPTSSIERKRPAETNGDAPDDVSENPKKRAKRVVIDSDDDDEAAI
eukprot:g334.t1